MHFCKKLRSAATRRAKLIGRGCIDLIRLNILNRENQSDRGLMTEQRRSFPLKSNAKPVVQGYSYIEASRALGQSSQRFVFGLINSSKSATV